jgi:hypothetical protein
LPELERFEMINKALPAYSYASANSPHFTNAAEIQEAI